MGTKRFSVVAILFVAGVAMIPTGAHGGVDVNVNLGIPLAVAPAPVVVTPQPVYIEEPPEMVVIPRSGVYFAPGVSVDLFFFDNRWWNRRGGKWYRASSYNGPWAPVAPRYVPAPVYRVPVDYRTIYVREQRIPYGQWKKMHGEREAREHHRGHGKGHRHHDD